MARDPTALPVQGPDNGTGNPLVVSNGTPANNQVDIEQIRGVSAVIAAAGIMKVGMTDGVGANTNVAAVGDSFSGLSTVEMGSQLTTQDSAANTAQTITLAAVSGKRNHITMINITWTGGTFAAAQGSVVDNGGTVMKFGVPGGAAGGNVSIPVPAGGLANAAVNTTLAVVVPAGGAGVISSLTLANRIY